MRPTDRTRGVLDTRRIAIAIRIGAGVFVPAFLVSFATIAAADEIAVVDSASVAPLPVDAAPAAVPSPTATSDYLTREAAPLPLDPEAARAPSLHFLHGNRLFLLGKLAANGGPGTPDPRLRSWLNERMLSAMSSLGQAEADLASGGLVEAADWPELEVLSADIDSIAARCRGIDTRLRSLRDDFAHHQATELMVALAAPSDLAAGIESVALRWNGHEVAGLPFAAVDRAALAGGGYRPLHRAFARPESHAIEVELTMSGGRTLHGQTSVAPEANRLTIIVLEAQKDGVAARVWTL
jgi:hypothetical protein